ncbi:MAG: hypothetical protein LQ343_003152 [Gyalolechia ehrenbergii]|nr:MAG: hypothetical protein LQ343_003152 [Gyalolechia ehrenbergii]
MDKKSSLRQPTASAMRSRLGPLMGSVVPSFSSWIMMTTVDIDKDGRSLVDLHPPNCQQMSESSVRSVVGLEEQEWE